MTTLTLIESLNLAALAFYGFIGFSMFLSGAVLVWRGFRKLAETQLA